MSLRGMEMQSAITLAAWPFEVPTEEPRGRTRIERLTAKARPDLARESVAYRMVRTDLSQATCTAFDSIADRYGLNDQEKLALRHWAYHAAVVALVSDHGIASDERKRLTDIQCFLDIGSEDAERIYESATVGHFQTSVAGLIQKPVLERSHVESIADAFSFDEIDRRRRRSIVLLAWKSSLLTTVRERRRLTDDGFVRAEATAAEFGIALSEEESTAMRSAFRAWYVESGGLLQPIPVDLNLQRGEACYASFAVLLVMKARTEPAVAYLTTTRIIVSGIDSSLVVTYRTVVIVERLPQFTLWDTTLGGSFQIKKTTGKPVVLHLPSNADAFYLTINRLTRGDIDGEGKSTAVVKQQSATRPAVPSPETSRVLDELVSDYERRHG